MLRNLRRSVNVHGYFVLPFLAQAVEDTLPDETSGRVVFVIVGVAIVALYLLLRRTRQRTEQAYWDRRRVERERMDNDPDMRRDD